MKGPKLGTLIKACQTFLPFLLQEGRGVAHDLTQTLLSKQKENISDEKSNFGTKKNIWIMKACHLPIEPEQWMEEAYM